MYKAFIQVLLLFVALCFTGYTISQCQPLRLSKVVNSATQSFNSKATFFEMYNANGDQLIIVQPYGWILLVSSEKVYAIEGSDNFGWRCSPQDTLAIKFKDDKREEAVCLDVSLTELVAKFTRAPPLVVSFEASKDFTVYNAIKLLGKLSW